MVASVVSVITLIAFASVLIVARRVRRDDRRSAADIRTDQDAAAHVHRTIDDARIDAARERGKAWY